MNIYIPLRGLAAILLATQLVACASTASNTNLAEYDRYENINRKIFAFNQGLDNAVLKPTAKGYASIVPKPVKRAVGNVFHNLYEPFTFTNDLLQAKPQAAADSAGRFILNSTIGLLGIFDVATPLGLPRHTEDFGQTFAKWGIPNGQYLMLPFFGPSTVLDTGNLALEWVLDPLSSMDDLPRYTAKAVNIIDRRAKLIGTDTTLEMQLDPYIFLRESYLQNRRKEVLDGKLEETVDEFEEGLFN